MAERINVGQHEDQVFLRLTPETSLCCNDRFPGALSLQEFSRGDERSRLVKRFARDLQDSYTTEANNTKQLNRESIFVVFCRVCLDLKSLR